MKSSLLRNYSQGVEELGNSTEKRPNPEKYVKGEQIYDLLEFLAKLSYTFYSNTK